MIEAAHNAKGDTLITAGHEAWDDGVKRAFVACESIGRRWIQGEERAAILESEAGAVRDDAGAEANLGAAFAELGERQKAILHLNRALQLDPGNALARENLAALRGAATLP